MFSRLALIPKLMSLLNLPSMHGRTPLYWAIFLKSTIFHCKGYILRVYRVISLENKIFIRAKQKKKSPTIQAVQNYTCTLNSN